MVITECSILTTASREAVWRLYQDPQSWQKWYPGIQSASMEGPLEIGTKGKIKPDGFFTINFEIVDVNPLYGFTDKSYLPLTRVFFTYTLEQQEALLNVTIKVSMKGLLAPVFAFFVGRSIKKNLPGALQKLVQLAESIS